MDDDHNFVMIRITEIRARRSVLLQQGNRTSDKPI